MPKTVNIPSQLVVKTAAQWAADATVYTAKRILITSDVFYGTTDQRKYKVSNGVDTWSNLDYFPANEFSAVMALVFSGFSVGANSPIVDGITIATAFARIQGQINARPNETATTIAAITNATASKNPPIDADEVVGMDSANSFVLIKYSWTNIKAFLKTYFDSLYQAILVSGTNIKTINSSSLLGAGDLAIGSDWELVDSASAANDATIDFTGLNSTYQAYVVIIANYIPQTDNTSISLRTSTDGGATFAATAGDYNRALYLVTAAGGNTISGSLVDTGIPIVGACGTGAGETANAIVNLFKPSATTYFQVNFSATQYSATPEYRVSFGGGIRVASADVDAIRFIPSSGNAASGEFRLYGIKNA